MEKKLQLWKGNFFFNWAGPGPNAWAGPNLAQLRGLGSAQPVWTVPSTVHMLREQWRQGRDEAGEKRRGEGLTYGGCNRCMCYWRQQAAALAVRGAVFLLSLYPLFYVLFSSSSSFGLPPLFSLLSLLFSSLPSLFCSCFFFSTPLFL